MSELNINVEGGSSTKLLTAGKYCPDDIIITASGGGGEEIEPIVLSGDQEYGCTGSLASLFINLFGNKITTSGITNATKMFSKYKNERIPFEINLEPNSYANMGGMFANAVNLKELPVINNVTLSTSNELFIGCTKLRNIPEDYFNNWDFTYIQRQTYANKGSIFYGCYSLRNIPEYFLINYWGLGSYYYCSYYQQFNNCIALDEVNKMAIHAAELTSNGFVSTFNYCGRLKNITFVTNEDGTAKTAKWKSQTINLSAYIGYVSNSDAWKIADTEKYNTGITEDKEVIDETTYQALKDNHDWYTLNVNYSRYNHDSAVKTINSLPDTSAYLAEKGGTNTIMFNGASGSATDGGAINTLTDAEIAVAAAKGWTVTLV